MKDNPYKVVKFIRKTHAVIAERAEEWAERKNQTKSIANYLADASNHLEKCEMKEGKK